MKLECVVVCVDYSDFLCWTLPTNKSYFNKIVVVTSKKDVDTQELCEYHHVHCVAVDFEEFNKAQLINIGLAHLDGDGWVLHMDADILLPPMFRKIIESVELDDNSLYSCDRLMCDNFFEWLDFWQYPHTQNENDIFCHLEPFKVGTRIVKIDPKFGGWIPIGFFQLWNQGELDLEYPEEHTSAARSDMAFSMKFSRTNRRFLPEIIAIHIESKLPEGGMGANWCGRKTPRFNEALLKLLRKSQPELTQKEYEPVPTWKKVMTTTVVVAFGGLVCYTLFRLIQLWAAL